MTVGLKMASERKALAGGLVMVLAMALTLNGDESVVVETSIGKLEGVRRTHGFHLENVETVTNVVDEFLGVPYAAPPVGQLRFQGPAKPRPWSGVRQARSLGPACPQRIYVNVNARYTEQMDEDCLYLNIYSPFPDPEDERSDESLKYPVMMFVHGGSFLYGTGNIYNGTALATLGVIVVTVNYRLDLLGFLSSGTDDLPGNYGLMDQIMAMEWIRTNIQSFRGDPSRVTIFGSSAGGASVGLAFLSPLAQGLFHRVIAQSGTANALWATHVDKGPDRLRTEFSIVADAQSCGRETTAEAVACLRLVPWTRLLHSDEMCFVLSCSEIDPVVKPVVDGRVLLDNPSDLLRQWRLNNTIPYMTGTVRDEFGSFGHNYSEFDMWMEVDSYLAKRYDDAAVKTIAMFYTDWSQQNADAFHLLSDVRTYDRAQVLGDLGLLAPTLQMASDIASAQSKSVYLYAFDLEESYHSVELNYIFGLPYIGGVADEIGREFSAETSTELMRRTSSVVMKLWTNFAKYGNPTASEDNLTDTASGVRWERYSPSSGACLRIASNATDLDLRVVRHLGADKSAFWNVIVPAIASKGRCEAARGRHDEDASNTAAPAAAAAAALLIGCVAFLSALLVCLVVCFAVCALRHRGMLRFGTKRR